MRKNLFSTPIWEIMVDGHEELNQGLLSEGSAYKEGLKFFDLPGKNIARLESVFLDNVNQISNEMGWRVKNPVVYSRQNPIFPGESDTPHWHPAAVLVGVYYVKSEPGQGDILLHDPRGGTWWENTTKNTDGVGKPGRTFYRISPVSGMLLLFPGYLIHSVEQNNSNDVRISIPMEYRFLD